MRFDVLHSPRAQLTSMLLLSAAVLAAYWIGEDLEAALPPFLILLVFTALIQLARSRSETVTVMSGAGDERTVALYTRAGAATSAVLSIALAGWWLVSVAQGDPNDTLTAVLALIGVTFAVSSFALARRG